MNSPNHRETDPPTDNHERERAVPIERHAQTIMGAVLVGLVFWVGSTLNTAQTQMAVLEERVVTLTSEVTSLRNQVASGIDDRYRRADAQRDFGRVWNHLASVDEQLDELERRLENNVARDKEAHP